MIYRKFAGERLFTGTAFADDGKVVVTDSEGKIIDVVDRDDAGGDVQQLPGLICPGFVNCHCHLELSHLKGLIPEGTGMVPFLLSVLGNRNIATGVIPAAIDDAEKMMMANGIVAVGDICNTSDTISQKKKRNLRYHHFVEALGITSNTAKSRFEQARSVFRAFDEIDPGKASIVPHAPYSVSEELFSLINSFDQRSLLSIHNQESAAEEELFLNGAGAMNSLFSAIGVDPNSFVAPGISSLQHYLPMIGKEHGLLLVHNVTTDKPDLEWIENSRHRLPDLHWCLCPNANLYISGVLPDIQLLADHADSIVIGTDSLASNHQLDVLSELKTIGQYFPAIGLPQLLQWATYNGAVALGMADDLGSLETGKKPGLVLIEGIDNGQLTNARSRRLI